MMQHYNNESKNLYEIDLKTFRENFDAGDIYMLEYIEEYLSDDLMDLFKDIMNYNEIYANGWTINDLFEFGKNDEYWNERAYNFIKKYNVPKKDYDEYTKYFEKYLALRDTLIDNLCLSDYLDENIKTDNISQKGFYEEENITPLNDLKEDGSYTVARVRNYGHCVELHYSDGEATVEYSKKICHDYWEGEVDSAKWFNKNIDEDTMFIKLWKLFIEYFENEYTKNDSFDEFCEEIHNSFKNSEIKNYITLNNICKKNNIKVNDYLFMKGFNNYFDYKTSLKDLPKKELCINEILTKIPNSICDSQYDLVYVDNEVCYYDCHNGDYIFIDTEEAMEYTELSEKLLQVDKNKSVYNEICTKYNLYDCIKNNCYINEDFENDIKGNKEINDFIILSSCADFSLLKENLPEEQLKQLEKSLESYMYYQKLYDDGDIDIIGEYENKYGNVDLIDWYEGLISTDEFIKTLNIDKEGELNSEL